MNFIRLSAVAWLVLTAPAQAAMYKWVDDKGAVHYSDQPPPSKPKSESTLNIPSQPGASNPPPAAKTWQEKEMEFRKRQTTAAEQEAKQKKAEEEAKTARDNCARAKQSLSQLESNQPVYGYDEKAGRQLLDEERRAAALVEARKAVADWCK